jgi:RNase H-fold protein (predicted Holliday junction resolvase)
MILAIDPGNERSGFLFMRADGLIATPGEVAQPFGKIENTALLTLVEEEAREGVRVAVEFPFPRGQTASWELFKTVEFVGQIKEILRGNIDYVDRARVKMVVCGSASAKDANIRAALIAIYGEPGKKAAPGPTFGITADVWAALGIAHTYSVEGESLSRFLRRRAEIKTGKAAKKARKLNTQKAPASPQQSPGEPPCPPAVS